jgi:hypothetical protein
LRVEIEEAPARPGNPRELPSGNDRLMLPMMSNFNVLPDVPVTVTARPRVAFTPSWLILRNPRNWVIHDVRIGNQSQFAQSGDIPGDEFHSGAIDSFVRFETAQPWMDVSVVASYVGTVAEGEPLHVTMVGRSKSHSSTRLVARWAPDGWREPWMMGSADVIPDDRSMQ